MATTLKENRMQNARPVVVLTLGDPAGIGAELIARLLAQHPVCNLANVVLIGDPWLWEQGQHIAQVHVPTASVESFDAVRERLNQDLPAFLAIHSIEPNDVQTGQVSARNGSSTLKILTACMDATLAGHVDAICFAPLNKQALKMGGMKHEDELHHFAQYLGVTGYFCEFNTLGNLWTSRISSHVPLKDVAQYLSQ